MWAGRSGETGKPSQRSQGAGRAKTPRAWGRRQATVRSALRGQDSVNPGDPPDRRKAGPFFGCSCTLPPTDGKLKNRDGDFPSCYVTAARSTSSPTPPAHSPQAPKTASQRFPRGLDPPAGRHSSHQGWLLQKGGRPADWDRLTHKGDVPAPQLVQGVLICARESLTGRRSLV